MNKVLPLVRILTIGAISSAQAWAQQTERNCSAYAYVLPTATAPANYQPRYNTIAHRFLNDERGVGPVDSTEYATLDAILDDARARLKPIPTDLDRPAYDAFALDALRTVDCVLVSHGFVYPGIGLVQLLSDGLDRTTFADTRYYRALLASPHNTGRTDFIEKRKPGPYYVVDCDIASFMYLAVGDVMKYPISMVDLPMHNFVRWNRPDRSYIDFETMDGVQTDDSYYQSHWGIPVSFLGMPGVLTTMTQGQLLAYHYFTTALAIVWKHDYPAAIAVYKTAISTDSTLNDAANNLAWTYTVVPAAGLRDAQQAVTYAAQAVSILADGDTLDTLACAQGLAGKFAEAVQTENRAIQVNWAPQGSSLSSDLALLKAMQICRDPNFGTDPRPFRPASPASIPLITNALSLNRLGKH
jgi:hypothetical protein